MLALYIADWLARKGNQVGTFLYGLAPFVMLVGLILGLVLLENDMGTAIIIAGLAAAMFFTAGANLVQFCWLWAVGADFPDAGISGLSLLSADGISGPI